MSFHRKSMLRATLFILIAGALAAPSSAWACACGCGIFDVGTSAMLPTHEGGMAYLEYDYMNQDQNWHNESKASADDNEDKKIRTSFYTAGAQYMFNRSWGAAIDVPFADRHFETVDEDDEPMTFKQSALGDIRLRGIFTGFSGDMATGVTLGVKLPTGDYRQDGFDRDTVIGTGSTDLLVGAFHRAQMTSNGAFDWFTNAQADIPVLITPAYRPGIETDAVLGTYYRGWRLGKVRVSPLAQALGSIRWSDTGADAAHPDSGYKRVFLSPGLEIAAAGWRLYGDIAFPVYQDVNGNQLVASKLVKVNLSRRF